MVLKAFAIFDNKAQAYAQPFFCLNRAMAERSFKIACNDPKTEFFHAPTDYTLFEIGDYHQDSGLLCQPENHVNCGLAAQFKDNA